MTDPVTDSNIISLRFIQSHIILPLQSIEQSALILYNYKNYMMWKETYNVLVTTEGNEVVNFCFLNAFHETVLKQYNDMRAKFEDEMASLAHMTVTCINYLMPSLKPLSNVDIPCTKQKLSRRILSLQTRMRKKN